MSKIVNTIAGAFDKARYDKLKKEYDFAVKHTMKSFIFEQQTVLPDFAKYLLEFLAPYFKDIK